MRVLEEDYPNYEKVTLENTYGMHFCRVFYPSVGSDHFPVGCTFHIDRQEDDQEELVKDLEAGEMEEVDELIEEG